MSYNLLCFCHNNTSTNHRFAKTPLSNSKYFVKNVNFTAIVFKSHNYNKSDHCA